MQSIKKTTILLQTRLTLIFTSLIFLFASAGFAEPPSALEMQVWVKELGNPSYHQRTSAIRHLAQAGLAARSAILAGLDDKRLEVRANCQRLLQILKGSERNAELDRLLSNYRTGHVYDLAGWELFRRAVGDQPGHRMFYAKLLRRHSAGLRWLDSLVAADAGTTEEIATVPETLGLDAKRLADGDQVDWAMMLLAASHPQVRHTPTLISEAYGGLLDQRVSAKLREEGRASGLMNLVEFWVAAQDEPLPRRSLIQVCLRFELNAQAYALSQKILLQGAAPSATQYALLALSKLNHPKLDYYLRMSLNDERVCHTWQVVGTARRTVRTEVRDTAMALLLHTHGFDPREFGYTDIQADSDTVFRDFSVGFTSADLREEAHSQARETLGF